MLLEFKVFVTKLKIVWISLCKGPNLRIRIDIIKP